MSKSGGTPQQLGNNNLQSGNARTLNISSLTKETPTGLEGFKYGFPSDGLSVISCKWWGNSVPDDKGNLDDAVPEKYLDNGSLIDDGNSEIKTDENMNMEGAALLSALRKRAVEEG